MYCWNNALAMSPKTQKELFASISRNKYLTLSITNKYIYILLSMITVFLNMAIINKIKNLH